MLRIQVRDFIEKNSDLIPGGLGGFRINARSFRSIDPTLYVIHLERTHGGVPVQGGDLTFWVKYGQVYSWGGHQLGPVIAPTLPRVSWSTAVDTFSDFIGGFVTGKDTVGKPLLKLIPVQPSSLPEAYRPRPTNGYGYRLIWEIDLQRDGDVATWQIAVDAVTGEVLSFTDVTRYAQIVGGVFPVTNTDAEVSRAMPYTNLSTGGYTNTNGLYAYSSGTVTTTLNGQYFQVSDGCGAISESANSSPGDIDFDQSPGTDCSIPAGHSAGDTHSSRSSFYHLNRVREKAATYLDQPTYPWFYSQVVDNVNGAAWCNATWGGQLNFYQAQAPCQNTGEIAGVFLHEWGHGSDGNDGVASLPLGTDAAVGEAYGDTVGMLALHTSCAGKGFRGTGLCGYATSCTECTGVRESDYQKYSNPTPVDLSFVTTFCAGYTNGGYQGRCGWEGHCESVLISQSVWDLATRDLPLQLDQASSWQLADRLFFKSRPSSGSAYTCTTDKTLAGCASNTWFKTFLVADDCDATASNGTPHAAMIFQALNRHGIACGTAASPENQDQSSCCPTFGTPTLSTVAGNNQIVINWTSAANAASYDVYRNEASCSEGFVKIGSTASLTFSDTAVVNGTTYNYRVQPIGSNPACFGPMSGCVSDTPVPCFTPGTPTGLSASPNGANTIDLSWSQGAPASVTFNVYRVPGGCAAPAGPPVQIATGIGSTSDSDTTRQRRCSLRLLRHRSRYHWRLRIRQLWLRRGHHDRQLYRTAGFCRHRLGHQRRRRNLPG